MNEFKKIIEINGVKMEVDLRTAKEVREYRVGDCVKVLEKTYSNEYQTFSGVIVGFDQFQKLPTITVAYAKNDYSSTEIVFKAYNEKSENIELAPLQEWDRKFDYSKSIKTFNDKIEKLEIEIEQIKNKKKFFEENYNTYFSSIFKNVGGQND